MGEFQEKTICWKCQNFDKCSWSRGKPVKGWEAEKVKINVNEDTQVVSYRVSSCPEFVGDKIYYATCKEIANILGCTSPQTSHLLNRRREMVEKLLIEKGYKLHTFDGDCGWYLENIENCNCGSDLGACK